jgi:cytochrome c biogenesis protein CcmG/thiol:disulfide interchange protein DsbE
MNTKFFIPLVAFAALVGLMLFGLGNDPKLIPSPFIGQQAPPFSLPRLKASADGSVQKVSTEEMKGKVWVLNLWASWCHSCRAEHAVLTRFIDKEKVPTIGLNYKDYGQEEHGNKAQLWLQQLGNPYYAVAIDTNGDIGLDWGVVGVPETFVMDKKGIVRYKFTGPVYQKAVDEKLIPLIKKLREEKG